MGIAKSIPRWREIQRANFTSLQTLCAFLQLYPEQIEQLADSRHFPLNVPLRLATKMEKGNLNDPILKQFVPLKLENEVAPSFVKDPVGDSQAALSLKYLKKYAGRILLLPTGACAMHCRYCFRQNYPYAPFQSGLSQELKWIREDLSLKEIILSGGDPLSLSNDWIEDILHQLSQIPHVQRIRFHTRFPIGIPERIDEELLVILRDSPKQIWFVVHSNHPRELDEEVLAALKKIQKMGIPVLNQSVLLKGVNDSVEVLQELSERLVTSGVSPYYLHQLDQVERASHFEVSQELGRQLVSELKRRLPGYAVPKYVQEVPGMTSKTFIT